MVTSSAVVGSSAISSSGSQASAIAIITRWRMPPDSWCGYSSTRRSGSGICTSAQHLDGALRSASARLEPSGAAARVSAICRPTVSTGFSEVIGSWKIIEMRLPRICRISRFAQLPAGRCRAAASRPRDAARRRGHQPQDRQRGHALAAARFADHAERLPAAHGERHAVDRTHHARQRVEVRAQVVDLEQRLARSERGVGTWRCSWPSLTVGAPGAGRARRAGRRRAG